MKKEQIEPLLSLQPSTIVKKILAPLPGMMTLDMLLVEFLIV